LLFPVIESVHVLAICLVVGSILVVDLRLLGLASIHRPVSRVTSGILPLTWSAFAVASGGLLFISNATKYLENDYFVAKIFLICAAGLSMAIFHATSARDLRRWENDTAPPLSARFAGGLSILLCAKHDHRCGEQPHHHSSSLGQGQLSRPLNTILR
jgi:hypothetical protein